MLAQTPLPPYYAVIFSSVRTETNGGYTAMADRMVELAAQQPGFLGVESARESRDDGPFGITVSYWESLEAIRHWRLNAEHTLARETGRTHWYETFRVRICLVEREYGFDRN
ncbi:MAG: antibiotic biosynthesis monooxygenase [Bacteroidetes bacterium]|nr:antibiotic biosynthesis monooxygenase [Fibrella sp.]